MELASHRKVIYKKQQRRKGKDEYCTHAGGNGIVRGKSLIKAVGGIQAESIGDRNVGTVFRFGEPAALAVAGKGHLVLIAISHRVGHAFDHAVGEFLIGGCRHDAIDSTDRVGKHILQDFVKDQRGRNQTHRGIRVIQREDGFIENRRGAARLVFDDGQHVRDGITGGGILQGPLCQILLLLHAVENSVNLHAPNFGRVMIKEEGGIGAFVHVKDGRQEVGVGTAVGGVRGGVMVTLLWWCIAQCRIQTPDTASKR